MHHEQIEDDTIEWSDAFSVGVPELDAQHRVMVGLLAQLQQVVRGKGDPAAVPVLIDLFDENSRIHFKSEETLLRLFGYPGLEAHLARHHSLSAELGRRRAQAEEDGRALLIFLKEWLLEHIQQADRDYVEFFV